MIDDIKAIFSKNLNVLMNRMGANVSDVSEKTGIPYSTVNDWKNGKKMPRGGNLQKLADYFHVNLSDLTSESSPTNIIPVTPDNMVRIPIIGTIACGDPILAEENIIGYRYHLKETLPKGQTFYLTAKGDSMEPKIPNGAEDTEWLRCFDQTSGRCRRWRNSGRACERRRRGDAEAC